ncbi:MAG: MBL fold metallo-hydrolase [Actinobacteria bacterium]|nr:MAG: MBL fold metallo-hydrolase [Actinomycetota bacterium]
MIFEQFYLESLGHASYLVGDEKTGRALLLDPRRDVEIYLESARMHGLRIAYAIDTHGHNDYLSGLSELRLRQDMEVLGFAGADLGYDHRSVTDGEVIEMGDLAFEVIHTPGHSPEHVSLLVYDHARGEDPVLLLAGGALLVGDVGRPDLLGSPDDVAAAARASCRTIRALLCRLGDHVAVYPTHVRGSLCGGNIGSRLSTTVGYERRTNPTLSRIGSSEECLEESLRFDHLPAVPPYWRRMRAMNLSGPPGVDLWEPPALVPSEFRRHREAGAIVVDTRSPEAFAGGHIPGALNVGLGSSFSTWAGTVLPEGARVLLVLDGPAQLWEAAWQLLRVGYDLPEGWLSGGMAAWRAVAGEMDLLPMLDVHELRGRIEGSTVNVVDVRQPAEWAAGHIEGATFITGADLPARLDQVPNHSPVAFICSTGYRSTIAASLLAPMRPGRVLSVAGGMSAWTTSGYPIVA